MTGAGEAIAIDAAARGAGRRSRWTMSRSRSAWPAIMSTRRWSAPRCRSPTANSSPSSGPTGCGKSTLLNVAAGLIAPSAGRRRFSARARGAQPPGRLSVSGRRAVSLEDRDRQCRDRARDRGHRRAQARERAQDWLKRVGLGGFGERYPHMLSGGQRKRVGLAQVLIRDPKILLMDEPFGPLDAQTRQIMGNLLLDLWSADRKAVMFVTHDLEEAIALSDRVVIMSAGPAARIIGDWKVPLPRPRDIAEVKLDRGLPRAAPRHLAEAEGRSAQGLRADGGRVMNRVTLIALQLLVAVVAISGLACPHHDSGRRQAAVAAVLLLDAASTWRAHREMVLRGHDLAASLDHAGRSGARLRDRLGRRRAGRLLVRAPAAHRRGVRSLCEDDQCAAAHRAGADLHALVRARHLVEGGARRHARVLHRVLQRLSGRARK